MNRVAFLLAMACAIVFPAAFADTPPLPAQADLAPRFTELGLAPRQQGGRDTCSLCAIATLIEFARGTPATGPESRLSIEYLAWAANEAAGTGGDNAMFYEALCGVAAFGVCTERAWPYASAPKAMPMPTEVARLEARALQDCCAARWIRCWDVNGPLTAAQFLAVKHALAAGHPVACGMRWPKTLDAERLLEPPPPSEVFDGHSVVVTGYTDDTNRPGGGVFRFLNSFGADWGDAGYGELSYAYARAYVNDALWLAYEPRTPGSEGLRIEAESASVNGTSRCAVVAQEMTGFGGKMWSGGMQLFCNAASGGWVELACALPEAGRYRVRLRATTAPDFGVLDVALDGALVVSGWDTYSGKVSPGGPVDLGVHDLAAGVHVLRIASTGRNASSNGTAFGIDAVEFLRTVK